MSTKGPECWGSDTNARALRVELPNHHWLLLPFDQLVYAELRLQGGDQHLRAVFGTHEVLVRGVALRRVAWALQRMELAFITPLPTPARALVPDGQPVIRDIVVTEVPNPDAAMPGNQAA